MSECKARAVMGNEAYILYAAMTRNKRNAADRHFSTALQPLACSFPDPHMQIPALHDMT